MKWGQSSWGRALGSGLPFLNHPPRWFELAVWFLVCLAIAWPRILLWNLLPAYLWSGDSEGYALPAICLVDRGEWLPSDKRGAVYPLFLAATLAAGDLNLSVIIQHIVGGATVLGCGIALRLVLGPASLLPVAWATGSFGRYNLLIYLEHLIRNETVLFLLSSACLALLLLAHHKQSRGWFTASGILAGLQHLTKPIMPLFLPAAIVSILLRRDWPRTWRLRSSLWLAGGFALHALVGFLSARLAARPVTPDPQSGKLLYARVAQWTVLDEGPHREIKDAIRTDIESYRQLGRRETNLILNRPAVPKIEAIVRSLGGDKREIHRVCQALAFEAIARNRAAFVQQIGSDLVSWHTEQGFKTKVPKASYLIEQAKELRDDAGQLPARAKALETVKLYTERASRNHFDPFHNLCLKSTFFEHPIFGRRGSPVLACSVALPIVLLIIGRQLRPAFAVFFVLWWSGLLILSTVGRPMDRYLLPLCPIIFFTLASLIAVAWMKLLAALEGRVSKNPTPIAAP